MANHIAAPAETTTLPDITISVRQVFGLDSEMQVPGFSQRTEHVPDVDESYRFDHDTTMAILAGFAYNRRVMIQGYHGTGKSTHIEQVAARLNWPCIRVNLDSHISRIDLIGKDAIVLRDGKQVTEYREGLLPWALQHPTALVFDEYDAGRPDVMFVIQRVLEVEGKLTLLDQNRVIRPHPAFRLFSTSNTVGLGAEHVGGAVPVLEPKRPIVDRSTLRLMGSLVIAQTPQVFRGRDLLAAHRRAAAEGYDAHDTAEIIHRFSDLPVASVPGDPHTAPALPRIGGVGVVARAPLERLVPRPLHHDEVDIDRGDLDLRVRAARKRGVALCHGVARLDDLVEAGSEILLCPFGLDPLSPHEPSHVPAVRPESRPSSGPRRGS